MDTVLKPGVILVSLSRSALGCQTYAMLRLCDRVS